MVPQLRYARTTDDVTIAYTDDGHRGPALIWLPPAPFSDVVAQYGIPVLRGAYARLSSQLRLIPPEVISKVEGAQSFGPVPRFALGHLPIERFLRLRRA
jgi:hypothetical protein